ncbi:MAG: hypothetical protein PHS96_12520, partial [Anaerolineales bacterium]|nr:hypothetical protein [Anaerolineales bacterium]
EEWFKTAVVRPHVRLYDDEFVVMPNHVHGVIWIVDDVRAWQEEDMGMEVGARRCRARTAQTVERFGHPVSGSIPTIVRAFKSAATHRINQSRGTPGAPVWQRNYYENIIRNERSLERIRAYILNNPLC